MGNLPSSPVAPVLTEKNVGDQSGKVFLVTGATSGVGRELAQILYAANGRVWITARSTIKAEQTIGDIRAAVPKSSGHLGFIKVDFNDLATVKPAVDDFLRQETTLNVLWNNAGIMIPPKGSKSAQKFEAQLGVNVLAPFLFTTLLTDTLLKTASTSPAAAPRVVWVSSSAARGFSPPGGVELHALDGDNKYSQWQHYGVSKAANFLLASEYARRHGQQGVISVSCDPGNLNTNLYKDMPKWQHVIAKKMALKPAIFGAYTELFAGLSPKITQKENGGWIIPWGATAEPPRKDIADSLTATSGKPSVAASFWDWCDKAVRPYA